MTWWYVLKTSLQNPSKLSSWWRRTEHIFSVAFICLTRRLHNVLKASLWRNCKTSSRRCLEEVLKTSCKYVLKTSWRRHGRCKTVTLKTSSRRCGKQEMFAGEDVLKTSWRCLAKRLEDVLKTFWRRLEDATTKTNILLLSKASWRRFVDVLARRLEDVLKTL